MLSVAGCGASRPAVVAHNRRAADRVARQLLADVAMPSGTTRLGREPAAADGRLKKEGTREAFNDNRVDLHEWLRVPNTWRSVVAFFAAHPPAGSHKALSSTLETGEQVTSDDLSFQWPASVDGIHTRQVTIAVAASAGNAVYVRVDAVADWLLTRSSSERLPRGIQAIEVKVLRFASGRSASPLTVASRVVAAPVVIDKIDAALERLPIAQPGDFDAFGRAEDNNEWVDFVFREVARARVVAEAWEATNATSPTTARGPMHLKIGGKLQTPLLEGVTVVADAERLLKMKL